MKDAYTLPNQGDKQASSSTQNTQASKLLADALVLQNELFDQGDLTPYLTMLSRMSYQNSRNLLLLMACFPSARCMAGGQLWRKYIPDPMSKILRPDQKGKGVRLLVPFSDMKGNAVTWFTAIHYDVSQVNTDYDSSDSPYNPSSLGHLQALLSSLHLILGEQYGISIAVAEDPEDLEAFDSSVVAGRILPGYFLLRPELSLEEKLKWLTPSLCQLYLQQYPIAIEYEAYVSHCAAHCLFEIWSLYTLTSLTPNPALIMSVPRDQRQRILDLLQNCVHVLDCQIRKSYTEAIALEEDLSSELASE